MRENVTIHLVAIDLDGTLLNERREIPESTVEAIQRFSKDGVQIVLASARPVCSILPYYAQLGLKTPIIAHSGAYIARSGGVESIVEQPLPMEEYRRFAAAMEKQAHYLKVYGEDCLYVRYAREETRRFSKNFFLPYAQMGENGLEKVDAVIFRIFIYGMEEEPLQAVKQLVKEQFPQFSVKRSEHTGLEILRRGVGKGSALASLCRTMGIDLANTMAIGNETSDICMIQEARLGVAMGNSCEALKRVADEITADHTDLGVERVLKKYLQE